MKEKIKDIISALGFISIILLVMFGCNKKNTDEESPILNVCDNELYISDYYNNGIDWDALSKDIDETCKVYYEEYYYENPKDICTDYIENNKEDIKANVCEE